MRLKSIYINKYKNLQDFKINFDDNSFIDIFVGKNGSGKSNFFEALIEIFSYLYEYDKKKRGSINSMGFDFLICYEIESQEFKVEYKSNQLKINDCLLKSQKVDQTILPSNIIVYYSGHNETVSSLVENYEKRFHKNLRQNVTKNILNISTPKFIGIDTKYKDLLLVVLLSQIHNNKAKDFINKKLGIKNLGKEIKIILRRPSFVDRNFIVDSFDSESLFWGLEGIIRDFLQRLIRCIKGEFNMGDLYNTVRDNYEVFVNIELFQNEFKDNDIFEIFSMFNNLKTFNMLSEVSISLILEDEHKAKTSYFSDGQFQSVYIYSIIEIFKGRNCLTLLDEPDSFLHPEWQHEFLKQVFEITDENSKNNHTLISSHSAVTLIPHKKKKIKFFDIKNNQTNCYDIPKEIAIKKLSDNIIKYSEQKQILSIMNAFQFDHKPILFTEGDTDPIIIKEAWLKLYEIEMPFLAFYGFSCTYLKQLLMDNRIHSEMEGLPLFGLFDFDNAYNHWKGLEGNILQDDPFKGMIKHWNTKTSNSYAIMIPIPKNENIQKQVIKNNNKETFGGDSHCEIEHLFYCNETEEYFKRESVAGGEIIVFKSDSNKRRFAKEIVPSLDSSYFEVFRPMFEFIQSKCKQ